LAKSLRIFFSTHRELDVPDDGLTTVGHGETPRLRRILDLGHL